MPAKITRRNKVRLLAKCNYPLLIKWKLRVYIGDEDGAAYRAEIVPVSPGVAGSARLSRDTKTEKKRKNGSASRASVYSYSRGGSSRDRARKV